MSARFWQGLLLLEAALAAIAAGSLSWLASLPVIVAWIIYVALLQFALIACSCAGAIAMDRARGPRESIASLLRAPWVIAQESCVLGWLQCCMASEPFQRTNDEVGKGEGSRPVLLLHGILCNRAVWFFLRRRLLAAGFQPVVAINLEPTLGSIDLQAASALRAIDALHRACKSRPVVVIAHSMGGLVARAAMRKLTPEQIAASIAAVITIATPHEGSDMARLLPGVAPTQMTPGSDWLRELNRAQRGTLPVPLVSIYSGDDNLVAPRLNARLPGGEAIALAGLGHFSLLASVRAWRELQRVLQPIVGSLH